MIEKELKYQLNKKNFEVLKQYMDENGCFHEEVLQKNYYFDTESFSLKNSGMTVRLRVKEPSSCEFTVKNKVVSDVDNCKIKQEENMILTIDQVEEMIAKGNLCEFGELFNGFKREYSSKFLSHHVKLLGCLKTKRRTYSFDGEDGVICIDESCYLGNEDYEVEWETEDLDRAILQMKNVFRKLSIKPLPNCDSKSSRFIKSYLSKDKEQSL